MDADVNPEEQKHGIYILRRPAFFTFPPASQLRVPMSLTKHCMEDETKKILFEV